MSGSEDMTVSLPGTNYIVTYTKPRDFVLVHSGFTWLSRDSRTSTPPSELVD